MKKAKKSLLHFLIILTIACLSVLFQNFTSLATNDTHTITFMSYDGSKIIGTLTEKSSISTNGAIIGTSIKGYTLIGWKNTPTTSVDGDNENVISSVKFDKDKTVYARYKLTTYKLTISYNNGTASKIQYYNMFSEPIILPNDITREQYTLKKWSGTGIEFDGEKYYLPSGSVGNKIANAIWEPKMYIISFDSQGGSDVDSIECGFDCSLSNIPMTQKNGYQFLGWYTSKVGGAKLISSTEMPSHNITYYAHWSPLEYLIELFSLENGKKYLYEQISYTIETDDFELPQKEKTGYFFKGWTGENIDTPQLKVVIHKGNTGNKTYYANWEENLCYNGHDYKNIIIPATFTKSGSITPTCKNCQKKKSKKVISKIKSVSLETTTYTYNGKTKKPTVLIKNEKGSKLKLNTDYSLTYKNNKNVGTATVKITFKGNYKGNISKSFTIRPNGTAIKSLIPESKKITVKWKEQTTQTTGYQIEYTWPAKVATSNIVTIKKNSTTSKVIKNLKNNTDYYLRIRTYKVVNDKKYYSAWSPQVKIHIDNVQLNTKSLTMYRGETKNLFLQYVPNNAKITWKSNDKKIATISSDGKVTAKSLGETTLCAKYKGKTYKATVKVTYMKPDFAALIYDYNTHDNYFIVKFKNNSPKTLTILSGTTKVVDYDYKNFDRNVYLSKSCSIKPGKSKTIKFFVKGETTWYDHSDFTLYYYIKVDGKKYYAKSNAFTVSKYKNGSSWVNSYRDKNWFIDWRCDAIP